MFEDKHHLPKLPAGKEIPREWYDEAYYRGLPKSNWDRPYNWQNYLPVFAGWATFILQCFPEAKSFLNVGCAQGFLERAILQTLSYNGKAAVETHGFDISEYAIANAEPLVKPFLQCASVDTFAFARNYEVLLCLDVAEHLTEAQIENFLLRSRPFVNDCCFFLIDTGKNVEESSHITLKPREWWHEKFLAAGWEQDEEMQQFQSIAMAEKFISGQGAELFIYASGNYRWD